MIKYIFLIVSIAIFILPLHAQEYILKKGDVLKISVWGEEDLDKEVTIDEDGNVSYALIGRVRAEGLTFQQLDDKITELLEEDYFVKPDVTVSIKEQQFFITGEVKTPGSYIFTGKISPIQAIALAGGFTDFASHSIRIIRQKDNREETVVVNLNAVLDKEGKIKEEYIIRHRDLIIVPRSLF